MPFYDNEGVRLFYEEIGEGRPLLLLHGLTSNHQMFYREIGYFQDKFRVIALDSRGHGESDRPDEFTLDDHIADAIALLDHLKLSSVYVLGISMGSYIAQGLAIRQPERVEKLILAATKSFGEQSSMAEMFDRYEEQLEGMSIAEKLAISSQLIFHDQKSVNDWQKWIANNSRMLNADEQAAASAALRDFDFRDKLKRITAETLVISGKHDRLNPPEKGRETAVLIPDADYMEFQDSGHAPNVEQDRLFLGVVEKFLG
ncbi:alpha/beta fold hydrolase [Planomicrobium sp. YIM 101495]|uniref:alpha/beta fold hydrolase n=1 Tax=Planomicrobium sp. YIM 101495 TaxID=2665160 RepID=UPI0012B7540F|nr:alpha/beta fold hydrolase [Planomicrobium sp. YIM 101495]MTD31899.1 alpha/beta fold hydrolase [Planomicrobium sp. YIM 101495]